MGKPLRVLVIEDSENDTLLLMRELRRGGYDPVFERVATEEEMVSAIKNQSWDIIIADYILPHFCGLEALRLLQKSGRDLPFIIVSGKISEEIAVETMKAGAHDYLSKSNLKRLVPAVERELGEAKMRRERKQLERELAQAKEEEFRVIFDNAGEGILIADSESKKFYMGNNAICQMLGYSPEEIKNLGVMDIHPEKDIPYVAEQFERQLKREFSLSTDLPIKRKDGSVFYADVNATTIAIAGKIYLMGFFHDTTDRKSKEKQILDANLRLEKLSEELSAAKRDLEQKKEALQKVGKDLEKQVEQRTGEVVKANKTLKAAEANLRKIITQNADGIIIVDSNGTVRFINPAACSLFNRKPEELVGEVFGFSVIAGQSTEIEVIHKDRKPVTAEMHTAEIEWEDESVNLVSIRDITKRKQAEEALKEANEKLKEYNQLKDEFVSTASHELRTPLSIIMGAIRLVLDEIPGKIVAEQKDVLTTAMESVNRLTRIVDSLLTISKIESGRLDLQKTVVNICELIKDTVSNYKPLAQEKNLSLDFEVPEEGIGICVDPDRIKEILVNLISNSLKFTPEGGWIRVGCLEQNGEVRICVHDSGIGIAKEDMPKLFDKFIQFGRKAGPGEKGTGLGLAIVKKLVDIHDGRIEVESELDKGTTFIITLPLTTEVPTETLPAETDELVEHTLTNN